MELIFKNPLSKPPARILRWALRVSSFNYTIKHKPGLGNIADFLSRHPLEAQESDKLEYAEDYVNMLVNYSIPKAMSKQLVLQETLKDAGLGELTTMIKANRFKQSSNEDVNAFSKVFNELSVSSEGFIIRDRRLVLPLSLRLPAIKLAHEGHQGLRKTKELLRSKVWFPNIDSLTENYYNQCSCQFEHKQTHITPITMSEMPSAPWTEISIDFFGPFDNVCLMVTHCDYSRFVLVEILPVSYDTKNVTDRLEHSFSLFGIPEIVRTDNGPPFQSAGFGEFANRMGFSHRKVTPYWPRANGEVESFMKNLGKVIRTAKLDNVPWRQRLREFLRAYRSTPHSTTKVAPIDLFLRNGNTSRLPTIRKFKPSFIDKIATENDHKRKAEMKINADKRLHTKEHNFKVGEMVIAKQPKLNKSTTRFDPVPYKIMHINGNMIVAQNENRQLCRNASFFAHFRERKVTEPLFEPVVVELHTNFESNEPVVLDESTDDSNTSSTSFSSANTSLNDESANEVPEAEEGSPNEKETGSEETQKIRRSSRTKTVPESYKDGIYRSKSKPNTPNKSKSKKESKRKRKSSAIIHIAPNNQENNSEGQ